MVACCGRRKTASLKGPPSSSFIKRQKLVNVFRANEVKMSSVPKFISIEKFVFGDRSFFRRKIAKSFKVLAFVFDRIFARILRGEWGLLVLITHGGILWGGTIIERYD
ncbi:hypothetical protein Zmor_021064 [Zophobas morio]|uniref:Uncharacterized protein n=1 Tax=Zophobas morio TaxID=2755281 RepID=A0AA38MAC7_9CUCU|nr:hypothetical protein Zmor_021064 [Zophobas morio]